MSTQTLARWWYAFANAVGGFIEEAAFRLSLATRVLLGKAPKPLERRIWDKDIETPILIDAYSWTDERHIFSVLIWPSLEVPADGAYRAQRERTEQVKRVLHKGAAEMLWTTRFEITYGLSWDSQRRAWVEPDGFGYAPSEQEREGVA